MTGRIRRRLGIAGVICALALFSSAVIAQESRGSIAGLVVDSSGGALPGVTVTIVNNGTNSTTSLVTNDTGQYTALFLLPGSYHSDGRAQRVPEQGLSDACRCASATTCSSTSRWSPPASRKKVSVVAERAAARDRHGDDGPGDRQQADQRDPARRRHRLRPDAARRRARRSSAPTRCSGRWTTTTCAASPSAARSTASSRSTARATSSRRRASASSRRRTPSRNSRSRPPPTTRRSDTPAPAA